MRISRGLAVLGATAGLGACCLTPVGEPSVTDGGSSDAGPAPDAGSPSNCTIGSVQVPNRAPNPTDPSLCCSLTLNPSGWSPRFVKSHQSPTATIAGRVVAGDFNGDGLSDVAVADAQSGQVQIFMNQAGVLVEAKPGFNVGHPPWQVVTVDLNRDGFDDLVTHNENDLTLSVLMSRGDGTFEPSTSYSILEGPSIVAGDFNGDGIPDVVCGCGQFFAGIGDGGFLPPVNIRPVYGELTAGDFNGDGRLDLGFTGVSDPFAGTVSVALGDGTGGFSRFERTPSGSPDVTAIASADFDRDGRVDLAVQAFDDSQGTSQSLLFLRGLGDGSLGFATSLPLGDGHPGGGATADLVGDGSQTLLLASFSSAHSVGQLTFADGGGIAPMIPALAGPPLDGIILGDFNGDRAQDLAIYVYESGEESISIYLNGCP